MSGVFVFNLFPFSFRWAQHLLKFIDFEQLKHKKTCFTRNFRPLKFNSIQLDRTDLNPNQYLKDQTLRSQIARNAERTPSPFHSRKTVTFPCVTKTTLFRPINMTKPRTSPSAMIIGAKRSRALGLRDRGLTAQQNQVFQMIGGIVVNCFDLEADVTGSFSSPDKSRYAFIER